MTKVNFYDSIDDSKLKFAVIIAKHNAVMIGDRIDNDIVPAKQLGMKTIWIKQGFGSLWTVMDESEKADIEVNNLSDILNYL